MSNGIAKDNSRILLGKYLNSTHTLSFECVLVNNKLIFVHLKQELCSIFLLLENYTIHPGHDIRGRCQRSIISTCYRSRFNIILSQYGLKKLPVSLNERFFFFIYFFCILNNVISNFLVKIQQLQPGIYYTGRTPHLEFFQFYCMHRYHRKSLCEAQNPLSFIFFQQSVLIQTHHTFVKPSLHEKE